MLTLVHSPQSRSTRFLWLLEELGAEYEVLKTDDRGQPVTLAVTGHGLKLKAPDAPLDCGNSGTTMRL